MKVFISSFCCLWILVGVCMTSGLQSWFVEQGLMPVQVALSESSENVMRATMTEVSLSQSVERLNRQSCESSKRKSEYFDDAHYDEDGCEIEDK